MPTFYLLLVIDHTHKKFFFRTEDNPGYPGSGSKHTLTNFCVSAGGYHYQITHAGKGQAPDFVHNRYMYLWNYGSFCEQSVHATVQASDSKEARKLVKPHRRQAEQALIALGYTKV